MTVILFVISLAALERSPGHRSVLLSLALGLFTLKNLTLTYFYLSDDLPEIHPLMFADTVVTGIILLRLLISGTIGSDRRDKEIPPAPPPPDPLYRGTPEEHAIASERTMTGESLPAEDPPITKEPPGV